MGDVIEVVTFSDVAGVAVGDSVVMAAGILVLGYTRLDWPLGVL